MSRTLPLVVIGIGLAAVSSSAIFVRLAQAAGMPSLVIAAGRLTTATLLLAPVVLWTRRAEVSGLTRRQWLLAAASGAFLGAHFATWISSLAYTSVASSVVLVNTNPLFVALLAAVALRERLSRAVLVGLALALTGAVVVGASQACAGGCPPLADFVRGRAFVGNLLATAGGLAGALYFTLGRLLRPGMSLLTYIFITYGTAAVVLCAAVLAAGLPVTGYAPAVWVWVLLLALLPQLVGHSSFNWALRYLPATYVSVTVLGDPAASILLAALVLGETPSALELAGVGLILAGIVVASTRVWAPAETAPREDQAPVEDRT